MRSNDVHIIGAGLSALVAAIKIRMGAPRRTVIIHQKLTEVNLATDPSLHVTPLPPLDKLSKWIGIDFCVLPGLEPLPKVDVTIRTERKKVEKATVNCTPFNVYSIYRGSHDDPLSLDHALFLLAIAVGVQFSEDEVDLDSFHRQTTIVATGLSPEMYARLRIKSKTTAGYYYREWSREWAPDQKVKASLFFAPHVIRDYFYGVEMFGLKYGFVFDSSGDRNGKFNKFFPVFSEAFGEEHDWIKVPEMRVPDCQDPFFYVEDLSAGRLILAGTLSPGMMEPVFYFGILGAILSGHIAAKAVLEGYRPAEKEFAEITRNFKRAALFRQLLDKVPGSMLEDLYILIAHGEVKGERVFRLLHENPFLYQYLLNHYIEGFPGLPGFLSDNLPKL